MGDGGNKQFSLLSRATPCTARGESAAASAGRPALCSVLAASGIGTLLAVSVPRLLMPCTELNVGQGYFLKSFVLAAGSSLSTGVQSSTSCDSGSLPQVNRVLFSTIRALFGVQDLVPRCCAGDAFALCPCRAGL